jgi:hypothetical protein
MDSDYPFGIFKFFKIILLARLRVTVDDSDNLDEYKCVLMLNLFAESYNKTQSGNVKGKNNDPQNIYIKLKIEKQEPH